MKVTDGGEETKANISVSENSKRRKRKGHRGGERRRNARKTLAAKVTRMWETAHSSAGGLKSHQKAKDQFLSTREYEVQRAKEKVAELQLNH